MAKIIISILLIVLSGCANLARDDAECDFACQKWDHYDNWGKVDPHINIDP